MTHAPNANHPNGRANALLALALFVAVSVGGGLAIGFLTAPGAWYAALAKPAFNPPNWVFAPVWTLLYVLIGVAGWLVWRARLGLPLRLWWAQLALNWLWSPVFFSAHRLGAALAIIVVLLAVIVAFAATTWRSERVAALLFAPYAAWVAFAAVLNGALLVLN